MKIPGWRVIHLHHPKHKLEIKRYQYRVVLVLGGVALYYVHHMWPEYEIHAVLALHYMVTFDPTA